MKVATLDTHLLPPALCTLPPPPLNSVRRFWRRSDHQRRGRRRRDSQRRRPIRRRGLRSRGQRGSRPHCAGLAGWPLAQGGGRWDRSRAKGPVRGGWLVQKARAQEGGQGGASPRPPSCGSGQVVARSLTDGRHIGLAHTCSTPGIKKKNRPWAQWAIRARYRTTNVVHQRLSACLSVD